MKILLTGATGFLGYRTLEKLITLEGVGGIIAAGRAIKDTHHVIHDKVKYELGSLSDPEYVQHITNGVDVIIHAAALSSPWGKREEFHEANQVSQELLVNAAWKKNVKRYIYVSTPSLYFNSGNRHNIKESDPLPGTFINEYARTKYEAELILQRSAIPHIILRPRALTGRGDTVIMPRLIRAYDEGKLRIIGSGKNLVDLTSVSNVADAIILSIHASGNALGKAYNISNGEPVNLWESIAYVLERLGKPFGTKRIPYGVAISAARMMEWKSKLTNGKEPALTCYSVGTLARSFTMDISLAGRHLGYKPAMNTKAAIDEFVDWYKTL